MRLSNRTAWDREESEFAARLRVARRSRTLLDLTVSNPTQCGFAYGADAHGLRPPGADARVFEYKPIAFGAPQAREAVVRYYLDHGVRLPAGHVCLTTSTSEAYGFLFQLLCDPGDEVLIARPSYPLLDLLARLHDVRLREYPLFHDPGHLSGEGSSHGAWSRSAWSVDLAALRASVNERTRAIIVVHPSNPTGNYASEGERGALEQLCAECDLALIVDEVFLDYALAGHMPQSFLRHGSRSLCFVLSGISKVCALPQMKVSWIAACGPAAALSDALERLEIIADTYLSLSAPAQYALPAWLAGRHHVQAQILERLASNLAALDRRLHQSAAGRLACEGGWTAVLRVPRHVDGTEFVLACLDRDVLVQPGSLYGLPEGRIVLSLLTPPEIWEEGLALLPV